jgi:hypothetical protein
MKLKTLALLLALTSTSNVFASSYYGSGTSTQIGNTTYHSGSYGLGTSTQIGNSTYHNFYAY